jgi:hypothetical protein
VLVVIDICPRLAQRMDEGIKEAGIGVDEFLSAL